MVALKAEQEIDYSSIGIDIEWNDSEREEMTMHTIHSYPAKFPAFIASKAFEYARDEGVVINRVADVFCGCGTVALEAKNHNYDFWGCDINPVATLIAKTKSSDYNSQDLDYYYKKICRYYISMEVDSDDYSIADERLKYWFSEAQYLNLLKLYQAIQENVECKKYRDAFECVFSSILKTCSRWLTKSIKPQIDPEKKEADVWGCFDKQYRKFLKAVNELRSTNSNVEIVCQNFLTTEELPNVDLIITSPPYVTSYEYADLHQLSSLWLNYTDDYKKLRRGSIGSTYYCEDTEIQSSALNNTGKEIVHLLKKHNCPKLKVKSVARYYLDMQKVIKKCTSMLNENGMVFFVIGDTEYKGVRILNSKHLVETLYREGFTEIKMGKRTISKGICVPFRDEKGKFSKDKTKKQIYHEEYIISGRWKNES